MQRLITFIVSILMSLISILFPLREEEPFECETIEIGGITYQNGVVPENMHFKNRYNLYGEEPVYRKLNFSLLGPVTIDYYQIEDKYIHRHANTSYSTDIRYTLFCPQDEWEELHSYYADDNNYIYYYKVVINNESDGEHIVENADMGKFNDIIEFSVKNGYLSTSHPEAERLTLSAKSTPRIRFYKESKDGFLETHTDEFYIYDGNLYLFRYHNGSTGMIEVATLPTELETYFSDLLKNGGYEEYFNITE